MLSRLRIFGKPLISTCKDIGIAKITGTLSCMSTYVEKLFTIEVMFFISNASVIEKRLKISWSQLWKKEANISQLDDRIKASGRTKFILYF